MLPDKGEIINYPGNRFLILIGVRFVEKAHSHNPQNGNIIT